MQVELPESHVLGRWLEVEFIGRHLDGCRDDLLAARSQGVADKIGDLVFFLREDRNAA